jgi:hypothetical protein
MTWFRKESGMIWFKGFAPNAREGALACTAEFLGREPYNREECGD